MKDANATPPVESAEPSPRASAAPRQSLVVASSRKLVRGTRRWAIVSRHYVWVHMRTSASWLRLLGHAVPLGATLAILFTKAGVAWGSTATILWVCNYFWKAWRDGRRSAQPVERNATIRSVALNTLISDLLRCNEMTPHERERFQSETLSLVASFVRDHRRDSSSPKIFANLLVEDGDNLVVVARDAEHRKHRARHPKEGMIVWAAMRDNEPLTTGDLYADYPLTPPGKAYRSILVIPVRYNHAVVGAVSIDSPSLYHFDRHAEELVDHLAPFVTLLSWTLAPKIAMLPAGEGIKSHEQPGDLRAGSAT